MTPAVRVVELGAKPAGDHPGGDVVIHVEGPPELFGYRCRSILAEVSMLVNIESGRYDAGMSKSRQTTLDPDVRLLTALADPTRLAIMRQLAETETSACDFTMCCDVGQPTVSHHLRVLREAGIVVSERRGQSIVYRLTPEVSSRLAELARAFVPGGLVELQ
jgi:ArsR family transcriptional regulator, arsenate/arsenite/antimonite-responsive transcriptional repressor